MGRCVLVSALFAASVGAFKHAEVMRPIGLRTSPKAVATRVSAAPVALAPAFRVAASIPTLYGLMSVNEYVTHRYFQHAEWNKSWMVSVLDFVLKPFGAKAPRTRGGGHVEHHAETLDDMTLKTDARWRSTDVAKSLDDDKFRGTAFTWQVFGLMTVQMLPTTIPVFKYLLGFSLKTTMAILLPGMLVHTMVWNALHPNMHALPDVKVNEGPPSSVFSWLRDTPYFRFLYINHQGHHIVGGRGNYNVACPGTDHLLGSFIPEKVWRPRATSTYASHHGEDVDFDQQIKNHIAREKFGILQEAAAAPLPDSRTVAEERELAAV